MKAVVVGCSEYAFNKANELSAEWEVILVTVEEKSPYEAADGVLIKKSWEAFDLKPDTKEIIIRKIGTDKEEVISFDKLYITEFDNRANALKMKIENIDSDDISIENNVYCPVRKASYILPDDVTKVKGMGFLWDKRTPDKFNGRVITRNGKITSEESIAIANAALKFGSGEVAMTSRQTIEVQGVAYENIVPMCEYLKEYGLMCGGTGAKVRPVVSCKGTSCRFGLIDTFGLSQKIHEEFFIKLNSVKLPHKFKIAVGGCPNNCVKPDINDLGIVGQRVMKVNYDNCKNCKTCQIEKGCPMHAAKVTDGKIYVDKDICNNCGRCLNNCPFGLFEEYSVGYKVFVGGRWGKNTAMGKPLSRILASEEEVLEVVAKAIEWYKNNGNAGERFGAAIERLGMENIEKALFDK